MRDRAVKCQWKLSSSLPPLLSIFLLAVFAKEEPLCVLGFVSLFRAGGFFAFSRCLKIRPVFPEQRHIWTFLKELQPLIRPNLRWLLILSAVWVWCKIWQMLLPFFLCLGTGQSSCSRSHSKQSPAAGVPVGWIQMSHWPPRELFWLLPSSRALCSSWSSWHPLQGLHFATLFKEDVALLLLGWCRFVHDKLLGGTAKLQGLVSLYFLCSTRVILKSCGVSSRAVCHMPCMSDQVGWSWVSRYFLTVLFLMREDWPWFFPSSKCPEGSWPRSRRRLRPARRGRWVPWLLLTRPLPNSVPFTMKKLFLPAAKMWMDSVSLTCLRWICPPWRALGS